MAFAQVRHGSNIQLLLFSLVKEALASGQDPGKVTSRPRLSDDHVLARRHATALVQAGYQIPYRHVRAFSANRDFAGALGSAQVHEE
jgi:hypothetical protein